MGPGRLLKVITDGIGWTQCVFESHAKASDGVGWAQRCFKTLLPMTPNGPRHLSTNGSELARGSLKILCLLYLMGPSKLLKVVTDGIGWAQCFFGSHAKTSDGVGWAQRRFKCSAHVSANDSKMAHRSFKMLC